MIRRTPEDIPFDLFTRLPDETGQDLLKWFEAITTWTSVEALAEVQSGDHLDRQLVVLDRVRRSWSMTRDDDVDSSFHDGIVHTIDGSHPAEFGQELTSVALQLLLPQSLPLWGRTPVDDSRPIYLERQPNGDLLVTFEHMGDVAQRSTLTWDHNHGLFTSLVRFSFVCRIRPIKVT